MSEKRLSGSIALTKLAHVRMTKKGKSGEIEGIFIPIKANLLVEGKKTEDGTIPVYMPVNVKFSDEKDKYGQNGWISKTIDSKVYKEMSDEEKEASKSLSPILGNIKDWSGGGTAADSAGDAGAGQVYEDDDDLPF